MSDFDWGAIVTYIALAAFALIAFYWIIGAVGAVTHMFAEMLYGWMMQ